MTRSKEGANTRVRYVEVGGIAKRLSAVTFQFGYNLGAVFAGIKENTVLIP